MVALVVVTRIIITTAEVMMISTVTTTTLRLLFRRPLFYIFRHKDRSTHFPRSSSRCLHLRIPLDGGHRLLRVVRHRQEMRLGSLWHKGKGRAAEARLGDGGSGDDDDDDES